MSTMTRKNAVAPEPVLFEVWRRDEHTRRWRRIGRTGTRAEALTLIRGSGDFSIREVRADAQGARQDANAAPNGKTPR